MDTILISHKIIYTLKYLTNLRGSSVIIYLHSCPFFHCFILTLFTVFPLICWHKQLINYFLSLLLVDYFSQKLVYNSPTPINTRVVFYFTSIVLSSPKRRLGSAVLTSSKMASLVILVLGDSLEK